MARILLCEDDDSVRAFVGRALELDGHDVTTTIDGADAVDKLREEEGNYELLVSDIKMPIMDGISLAMNTAREWPELTILLMTGFADQRERAHGLTELVHDVVLKPFSLSEIRHAVSQAL